MPLLRIAIVEESEEFRELLTRAIELSHELRCVGAFASGREAHNRIPRLKPEVVVMDLALPDMSAIACAQRLKAALPKVAILLVASARSADAMNGSRKLSGLAHVTTPLGTNELLEAIKSAQSKAAASGTPAPAISRGSASLALPLNGSGERTLTPREHEIMGLLAKGRLNKEIGDELGISPHTVRHHLENIFPKLGAHTRTEASVKYLELRA